MAGIVYEPLPQQGSVAPPAVAGPGFSPQTFKDKRDQYDNLLQSVLSQRTTGWLDGLAKMATSGFLGYQKSKNQEKADTEREKASSDVSRLLGAMTGSRSAPAAPAASDDKLTNALVQSRSLKPSGAAPASQSEFIAQMAPHAMQVAERTGLDPRLVIAQAALESGWGKSAPGNNFFGIKSHGAPGGQSLATTEVINGQPVSTQDSFRTYSDMGQSAQGYADFLQQNPRYREMLSAQGLDAQVAALRQSGYATDPNYASKVGSIAGQIDPTMFGISGTDTLLGGTNPPQPNQGPQVAAVGAGDMPMAPGGPEMPASMQPGYQPIGSQMPQQGAPPAGQGGNQQLQAALAIMSNPWADEGQKQVAGLILQQAMKQDAPVNGVEINNRLVNPRTGSVIADFSQGQQFRPLSADEKATRGLPSEGAFQIGPDGKISQIGGGGTTINLNSASNQEAIRGADQAMMGTQAAMSAIDRALELNEQAASGQFAGTEQMFDRMFNPQQAAATTEMNTLIMGTALDQLKSIFGGNPTEGERKILLDMQGVGNMTRAERSAVLRQARAAAERRLALAQSQSQGLRTGDYYKPGYQPPSVTPAATAAPMASPQGAAPPVQSGNVIRYDAQGNRIQ